MRVRNIELTFGIEPRETAYLLNQRFGFDLDDEGALLCIGRFSWFLTW